MLVFKGSNKEETYEKNSHYIILVFLLITFTACSPQDVEKVIYLLSYDSGIANIITTTNESGTFYILEEPITANVPSGTVEIYGCYYDSYAINVCMYVETENRELFETKANDEKHSIYPVIKVNDKEIGLSSYGYSISHKQLNSTGTCYKLVSSYNCPLKNIKTPIKIIFDDVEIEIPLVATKGYFQHSQEGQKLWEEYNIS